MSVTSARNIVNLKENGHFQHKNENERIHKYTLSDELPVQVAALRISTAMQPAYTLRRITEQDRNDALEFLKKTFFLDEPLNQSIKLLETPDSRCIELEEYITKSIPQNVSVAAVDENGQFVGIAINGLRVKQDSEPEDDSSEPCCKDEKFRRIMKILYHLDREAKIFEKLPSSCDKVMEVLVVSTHPDWRGRGLMKVLCLESERIAKSHGASAMRMDTTSAFSAAAADRLGYKKVLTVPYADLDYAPRPEPPHVEASVYLKEI